RLVAGGARFGTYATGVTSCAVRLFDDEGRVLGTHAMSPVGAPDGPSGPSEPAYFEAFVAGVGPGALYKLVIGDRELPDPYARWLPHGVHGPACLYEPRYAFKHPSVAPRLSGQVVYELHIGTFTPEGTYDAARAQLGYLASL